MRTLKFYRTNEHSLTLVLKSEGFHLCKLIRESFTLLSLDNHPPFKMLSFNSFESLF